MAAEVHVNDIGTAFQYKILDENCNIVSLSGCQLSAVFLSPDGTRLVMTPSLVTNGLDGLMQYITASGDIYIPGMWRTQAIVQTADQTLNSNVLSFKVQKNI